MRWFLAMIALAAAAVAVSVGPGMGGVAGAAVELVRAVWRIVA